MTPVAESEKTKILTEIVEETKAFLNRESFLKFAGKLRETELYVDGLGWLLLSEITGDARAEIVAVQSVGLLADQRKIDRKSYERALILAGVVDPSSPDGDRKPMFRPADMDHVMRLGGQKIADIVEKIEELSALGAYAGGAEGNSGSTQNGAGTS